MLSQHADEVASGGRFAFGENWARFLQELNDDRIALAKQSLCEMLGAESLQGLRFLDIGSGSGLFSLVARKLGATVHSFDYDPQSVSCTAELKRRYAAGDSGWTVGQASVLDESYIQSLGQWDIVYSWGVLHHTGEMNRALANAARLVAPGGKLFIAIYNDQGWASKAWLIVKKAYNGLPPGLRWLVLWPAAARLWGPTTIRDLFGEPPLEPGASTRSTVCAECRRSTTSWIGSGGCRSRLPSRTKSSRSIVSEGSACCGCGHAVAGMAATSSCFRRLSALRAGSRDQKFHGASAGAGPF